MTPAEFRTLRMSLGLTAKDIATCHSVNLRTAQRWESTHTPPQDIQDWIQARWEHYADLVDSHIIAAEHEKCIKIPVFRDDMRALKEWGMTANESTALVGHIAMALTQRNLDFEIVAG